jgi:hypothetical protein
MRSINAIVVIALVLTFSALIWYSRIKIGSKSLRLLVTLVLVSTQILVEVYLTFDGSPLRLQHIPILHLLILALIYLSSHENTKKVSIFIRTPRLVKTNLFTTFDLRSLWNQYWFLPLFMFSLCVGFYPALFGGPSTVDERAYHWPQILGIVQNNGFTTFDSSLPWTYTYPLGKAAFSAFTWPFVQTDLAFRSVQIIFGIIALLSIYILGRNFSHITGILSALILASSPVFSVMLRMTSDDLAYGALALASLALISEACNKKHECHKEKLFAFGLLSFALSGQFKFPVIATLLILPMVIRYTFFVAKNSKLNAIKNIFFLVAAGTISFIYAFRNLLIYNNPFYPMTVQFADLKIFTGPLISINNETIRPSTTFSLEEPFRLLKTWHATFFDFFQVPNEDSMGSYNFIVGILLIAAFFYALTQFKAINTTFKTIIISSLFILLVMPGIFLPRYGFFVVFIFIILSMSAIAPVLLKKKILAIFAGSVLVGLTPILLQNNEARKWVYSQSEGGDVFKNGQSFIDRKFDLAADGTVLPAIMVDWIQGNVLKNQRVCYSAATNYPSLFWNLERTSNVRYLPILETDRYPNSNIMDNSYSTEDFVDWLSRSKECDYLLTYRVQSEMRVLFADWERVLDEPTKNIWMLKRVKN